MKKRGWKRAVLVIGVVLAGFAVMMVLILSRKAPQQMQRITNGALVEVMRAERGDQSIIITGQGTVRARHEVALTPQVSGQIVWVHPDLVDGGSFRQGETMLRIEPEDYQLRVQQAEAQVAQANYQLELAEANAQIARREWDLVQENRRRVDKGGSSEEPDALVLHEPQLRQARANLASAEASLEQARLNLKRTEIAAPFDCMIRSQSASPGQTVGPQSVLARVYSTDIAEIEVSLASDEIGLIDIPGAKAEVIVESGGREQIRKGVVHRRIGVLDEVGRLGRVVVRVNNPFQSSSDAGTELALGDFVKVRIEGITVEDVVSLPRSALHAEKKIWVAAADSSLEIRNVEVFRSMEEWVLIRSGIEAGDLVVLTPLTGAAPGMKLRPREIQTPSDVIEAGQDAEVSAQVEGSGE